jgi:branched-chain amino acid transport system substrate-binding protein
VYQVAYNHPNMGGQMDKWMTEFNAKYKDDFYTGSTIRIFETLGAAMAKAKSTDPVKVAAALEGLKVKSFNGESKCADRPPAAAAAVHDGLAESRQEVPLQPREHRHDLRAAQEYPNYVSSTPTSCQMKRPG